MIAGVGVALGMALPLPALANGPGRTRTTLTTETQSVNGHTVAMVSVGVIGEDSTPATGAVVVEENGRELAGAALSGEGRARIEIPLPAGEHSLTAKYVGDAAHQGSVSDAAGVRAQPASTTPDFQLAVNPASLSLTAGQSGSAAISLTPVNANALTAPMFVTLSCSGFPDQSTCTFTPENVEILPNATAAVTSSMVISTQAKSLARVEQSGHPVAWAVLLPGTLGLVGLAFSARRRRWLSRLSMLALLGLVTVLGATACAPRYSYYNHGPPYNLPTPAGSYTLLVTAQSSNGVAATTHSVSFALTVK